MKSKADQYVEDYRKYEECKEPELIEFVAKNSSASIHPDGTLLVHNFGHIQKEHALAFAQWIIDTYSVPDWRTPVAGRKYKTRGGEMVVVISTQDGVLARIRGDDHPLNYDAFPLYYLKATSDFDIIGFWEDK